MRGWTVTLAAVAVLLTAGAARASDPYVDYVREGRLRATFTLECSASGRCVLSNGVPVFTKRRFTLTRTRLATLQSALHDARWRSLRSEYGPFARAEKYYDAVTYAGRRVAISSQALDHKRVPRRLGRVLDVLNAIVTTH